MPTDQYHEPPDQLSPEIRTFARVAASLQEEAEAIGWYEQRMSLERDPEARGVMEEAQEVEIKHHAMALEFLSRRKSSGRNVVQAAIFKPHDNLEHGDGVDEPDEAVEIAYISH